MSGLIYRPEVRSGQGDGTELNINSTWKILPSMGPATGVKHCLSHRKLRILAAPIRTGYGKDI